MKAMPSDFIKRKPGPDLLKIAATIYVIIIHHKFFGADPVFMTRFLGLSIALFAVSLLLGAFLFLRAKKRGGTRQKCLLMLLIPLACFASLAFMRKFAVAIFMLVTGYLLTSSIKKYPSPIKSWYTRGNIIPRIMRFYLPFVPVFIVGLVYKIIVKDYEYTISEVIARFILGGFKPGSYYITILAEVVLVFPLIYLLVKKYKRIGVLAAVILNLVYDALCTFFGMNHILYKFLVFRFITHIALGIYGALADFKKDKGFNTAVFITGFVYVFLCTYAKVWRPPLFFQWHEASFPVALFMYVPVMWFINATDKLSYTDTKLSQATVTFANATYHIFLIQLLYYTTFGFEFNAWMYNVAVTMPLNVLITVPLGIWYFKLVSPAEKHITDLVSKRLNK